MLSPRKVSEAFTELAQTAQQLLAVDQNMPEDDQRLWQDMLEAESLGDPLLVLDRLVHEALLAEHYAQAVHDYTAQLSERHARYERRADKLREVLANMLEQLQLKSLERPTYTATMRAGIPAVRPTREAEAMPPRFQRLTVSIDTAALKAALKAGEKDVPAEWSNAKPILTIRVR